ncbi:MAG TPA: FAD/NAD(P)-binding protein [Candidatus Hydrogenedentes bacterium]|nr:FAD/NAD(P)-binding protein [Candidatus Hydrogenedentota bacterium]HRK34439.1 FAD/NAD(P)-binding protein [Candidatus Hydrogenedentota bacterium]
MNSPIADPMLPRPFRIQSVRKETTDTFTFELAHPEEGSQNGFEPGQFNMLYVFGVGEVAISISGDSAEPGKLIHTTRAVGTVTQAMARLKPGQVIGVRGPYGRGWPIDDMQGQDIVVVTGGIGLAPLRPLLYRVLANRGRFGRVVLLYGARTPNDILYKKELERWRGRFDMEVLITVDRSTGGWRGHVGVVTQLISGAPFDPYHATAFICGPEIMMKYSVDALTKRGLPSERVYVSMERNMKCAVGFCGHCQYGPKFVCKDGPVFPFTEVKRLLDIWEV